MAHSCFISYARRPLDETACRAVMAVLGSQDIPYWSDHGLVARDGAALNEEIATALAAASLVIFLASSQSMASPYCQAEIISALQSDKLVLRVDVEPAALPPALLPLASTRRLAYTPDDLAVFEIGLIAALAALGVGAGPRAGEAAELATLDVPDAAIIRPSYRVLREKSADLLAAYARRLAAAATLAPDNGYTHLSLAFLHLAQRDTSRAAASARRAAGLLPRESDAHYAEALTRCATVAPQQRTLADVEGILRQLAVARNLPRAGAHVDLLSALVIAGYYGPAYLTPPAEPHALLRRGLSLTRRDAWEALRVLETEPLPQAPFTPSEDLLRAYLISG